MVRSKTKEERTRDGWFEAKTMLIYLKLGTMPMKRHTTKKYDKIEVGDEIEIMIRRKWQGIKIEKIYDGIPMKYFGYYP